MESLISKQPRNIIVVIERGNITGYTDSMSEYSRSRFRWSGSALAGGGSYTRAAYSHHLKRCSVAVTVILPGQNQGALVDWNWVQIIDFSPTKSGTRGEAAGALGFPQGARDAVLHRGWPESTESCEGPAESQADRTPVEDQFKTRSAPLQHQFTTGSKGSSVTSLLSNKTFSQPLINTLTSISMATASGCGWLQLLQTRRRSARRTPPRSHI